MYDETFYDVSRAGMQASAHALVPMLMPMLQYPRRVIDVGCGEGWWAKEFENHGCEAHGIDGGWHGDHQLGDRFTPHNLKHRLPKALHGQFDVALGDCGTDRRG